MKTQADHARAYRQRKAAKLEKLVVLEGALRNLLDFIGDRDMRIYATDLVVVEARKALGDVG